MTRLVMLLAWIWADFTFIGRVPIQPGLPLASEAPTIHASMVVLLHRQAPAS
jgi:hypothetical protein